MEAFQLPTNSTPSFSEFDPTAIPYQAEVIDDLYHGLDFGLGVHEILLSGSVGSAKSLLMAHCGLRHLFEWPGARGCLARQAMPDLRDTIYTKILEHLEGTVKMDGTLVREGVDFGFADTNCRIWLANGSEFISRSWADKKFKKLGSLEFSIVLIEELSENDGDYWKAYSFLRMRVGRLPHVPVNWIMAATNPDSPGHPAYKYFEIGQRQALRERLGHEGAREALREQLAPVSPTKHVYFSNTRDNPFLPPWYVDGLLANLDAKMARRMVGGEWVEIDGEGVYHAYRESQNYVDQEYVVDPFKPIYLSFDFNIGQGKPMSACLSQVALRNGEPVFHFFADVVVEGADTDELLEEIAARGHLEHEVPEFIIHGDATGASRTTKSKKTDYDLIREFLAKFRRRDYTKVPFKIDVPLANPPIRERHNRVNAYCRNALGKVRLVVYNGAKTLHEGFKLTALKKGGQYIEDDSKSYQHLTTAAGYHICRVHRDLKKTPTLRETAIR
jgi:hypothetical protein